MIDFEFDFQDVMISRKKKQVHGLWLHFAPDKNKYVRLVHNTTATTRSPNDMISFFSKLSLNNAQKPPVAPVELAKPAYMDKSATLQELGYNDENDLRESIYGLFS